MNQEENNKQIVNPFDYVYDNNHLTGINSNAILSIMSFLHMVIDKEPKIGALLVYPKKVEEIKDDKGELQKVSIEWAEHTPNSFFLTAVESEGSVPIITDLALRAEQLLYGLTQIHQDNINKGVAKKQEDINDKKVFE
jgi:hypothetical protein